jgi:hypothetical protein
VRRAKLTGGLTQVLVFVAAAPMLMGTQCEEPLVQDSGFDLWCGDTLCAWQVDAGSVAKIPTWNERDYGVALLGDPAALSQLLRFSSEDVSCIHLDLLADIDDSANVVLALDFDDDGSVEHAETVPSGAWTPISYHVVPPTYFHSVRISIRKVGGGRAELAQIRAAKASDCAGPPPLGELGRPVGATCEVAAQCGGGLCLARAPAEELVPDPTTVRMACGGCAGDGDCAAGSVCGLGFSQDFFEPFPACAPTAAALLGERCVADAECASGACCAGVCSTCCSGGGGPACGAGDLCRARAQNAQGKPLRTAWQCAPGEGRAAAGEPCLADADCAGGSCAGAGTLSVCGADGRRCAGDADCPAGAPSNPCLAVGVAGGRCR